MNLFDSYSRPLPRFYDLTIERRAQAMEMERAAVHLRRAKLKGQQFRADVDRVRMLDDSVALLDVVPMERRNDLYKRILTGAEACT